MARKDIKTLREEAEALVEGGVRNKVQLIEAVPALIELQNAAKAAKKNLDASNAVARALSKACSEYAHEHPEYVFGSFMVSPIGVESGDLEIDGRTYHFKHGFEGYVRSEEGKLITQEFLAGLPEGWAKSKLELDTTALNKAEPKAEELEEFGLMRKVKQVWAEI